MSATKTRFERVSLEDLKKILPDQVPDGHHAGNDKGKKKDKRREAATSKPKSKA